MGFLAVALVIAVLVVVATRGSLRQLAQLPVEGFGMLFVALGIQVVLNVVHLPSARVDDVGFGLLLLSYACILGFCFANFRLRGMAIVTIGIGLNALVIALNQGMPADGPTRVDAQGRTVSTVTTSVKHRPQRPGDVLTVLDDRIVVRVPFHEILSFGDLILALGLIDVCYWGSRLDERERLSVFALTAVPGPPSPPPASASTAAPAAAARAAGPVDVDASPDVEPPRPSVDEIDLTTATLVDPADAAWLTTPAEPEPADDADAGARVARRTPRRIETRADPSRLDDESETALWLAAP